MGFRNLTPAEPRDTGWDTGAQQLPCVYAPTHGVLVEIICRTSKTEPENFLKPSIGLSSEISCHKIAQMIKIYLISRKERK